MSDIIYGFSGFKFRILFYRHGYAIHYAEHVIDPIDNREKLVMADPHNRFSVAIYDVARNSIEEFVVPGRAIPNPHVAHMLLEDISKIGGAAGDIICPDRDGRWVLIDRESGKIKWSLYIDDAEWPHDIVPIDGDFIVTDYGSGGYGGFVRRIRYDGETIWSLQLSNAAKISKIFGSTASGIHSNSFGGHFLVAQNADLGAVYELSDNGEVVWRCPKIQGTTNSTWLFKPHSAFRMGLAEAGGNLTVVGLEAGGGIIAIDYNCRPRWGITSLYSHIPSPHYTPSSYGLFETTHVFPTLRGSIGAVDWRGHAGSQVIEVVEVPKTGLAWILALGIDPGNGVWLDPPLEILDREYVAMDIANNGDSKIRWSLYVTRQPAITEMLDTHWILYSSGIVDEHSVQSIELDNRRALYTFARLKLEKIGSGRASVNIFVVWL